METPKLVAEKNHFDRQITKLRSASFPQAHDLACRLCEEAFATEAFKELFVRYENLPLAEEAAQSMLGGTYFELADPFTRAAFGYHFLKKFIPTYRTQYRQLLWKINEQVDDNERYQIFLDRYCILAFLEYLLFFLDEVIAGGGVGRSSGKEEAFISYSTSNKVQAGKIKAAFDELKIDSFLAHEDIEPAQKWLDEILEHLGTCSIFVPLITDDFVVSEWTQQEAGMAMSRSEVVTLPICLSSRTPPGFLARYQALRITEKDIDALTIGEALLAKKIGAVLAYFIGRLEKVKDFRIAERLMKPIVPYFKTFSEQQAIQFAEACIGNGGVWDAALCRDEMIPEFIRLKGSLLKKERLEVLESKIKKG